MIGCGRSRLASVRLGSLLARTIAVAMQKGGVGKTTTAVNLGAALAEIGQRVLLIDLDAQGHLTLYMKPPAELDKTIYHLLVDPDTTVTDVVQEAPQMGVHYIPADVELAGAENQLINEIGRESILRDKLEAAQKRYDFIIIDCPPSLDLIVINALVAADEVLVPLQAEFLALKGMQELLITMERVKRRLNPRLELIGILPTCTEPERYIRRRYSRPSGRSTATRCTTSASPTRFASPRHLWRDSRSFNTRRTLTARSRIVHWQLKSWRITGTDANVQKSDAVGFGGAFPADAAAGRDRHRRRDTRDRRPAREGEGGCPPDAALHAGGDRAPARGDPGGEVSRPAAREARSRQIRLAGRPSRQDPGRDTGLDRGCKAGFIPAVPSRPLGQPCVARRTLGTSQPSGRSAAAWATPSRR